MNKSLKCDWRFGGQTSRVMGQQGLSRVMGGRACQQESRVLWEDGLHIVRGRIMLRLYIVRGEVCKVGLLFLLLYNSGKTATS